METMTTMLDIMAVLIMGVIATAGGAMMWINIARVSSKIVWPLNLGRGPFSRDG